MEVVRVFKQTRVWSHRRSMAGLLAALSSSKEAHCSKRRSVVFLSPSCPSASPSAGQEIWLKLRKVLVKSAPAGDKQNRHRSICIWLLYSQIRLLSNMTDLRVHLCCASSAAAQWSVSHPRAPPSSASPASSSCSPGRSGWTGPGIPPLRPRPDPVEVLEREPQLASPGSTCRWPAGFGRSIGRSCRTRCKWSPGQSWRMKKVHINTYS